MSWLLEARFLRFQATLDPRDGFVAQYNTCAPVCRPSLRLIRRHRRRISFCSHHACTVVRIPVPKIAETLFFVALGPDDDSGSLTARGPISLGVRTMDSGLQGFKRASSGDVPRCAPAFVVSFLVGVDLRAKFCFFFLKKKLRSWHGACHHCGRAADLCPVHLSCPCVLPASPPSFFSSILLLLFFLSSLCCSVASKRIFGGWTCAPMAQSCF